MVLVALIIIVILVGLFVAFLSSARLNRQQSAADDFPTLSFDSQTFYRPIRALRRSILETIRSSDDPAISAMSGAVSEEVESAHNRVILALQARDQLRKASEGHKSAELDMQRMLRARDSAESSDEKLGFTRAYEAKASEVAEYEKARDIIRKIEAEIELTKASLSELKAKITFSEASTNASERAEDLRSTLSNLETIQSSVDEAQTMLRS